MKKAGISQSLSDILQLEAKSIQEFLHSSYRKYSEYKRQAAAKQGTWLDEIAEARAQSELREETKHSSRKKPTLKDSKQVTSKCLQMLKAIKSTRKMHRHIIHAVGRKQMAGVSMVITPDASGHWREITDEQGITSALIHEYQAKYHQTDNTPPMNTPMKQNLGPFGTGTGSNEVLDGRPHNIPKLQIYSE